MTFIKNIINEKGIGNSKNTFIKMEVRGLERWLENTMDGIDKLPRSEYFMYQAAKKYGELAIPYVPYGKETSKVKGHPGKLSNYDVPNITTHLGYTYLSYGTPYARRMYYGDKAWNWTKDKHEEAGPRWLEKVYINHWGEYEDYIRKILKEYMKEYRGK